MSARNLTALATLVALAAPAVAQEAERPLHVELRATVQHATMAAAHATRVVEHVLPATLAAVEPALHALEPMLAQLHADVEAAVLPAFGSLATLADDIALEFSAVQAPAAWAPQDPADSLYRAARRALNDQDYARAAQLFNRIRAESRYRSSEYRALAFYYEAFARQRVGGRAELQRARAALEQMQREHPDAWREQRDAPALMARLNADLARQGDTRAAQAVQARSTAAARSACTDGNMAVRVEALNALLQMDAESALPILEEVMKRRGDECSAELRRKAVFLIAQKRTERTADLLLDAARNDPDSEVQEQAVFWLSQVDDQRAVTALEEILKNSGNAKVQERAIFAISQHRHARAAELLRNYALRPDVSDEMRGQAIFWIGQSRGAENVRFLHEIYPRLNSREVKEKVIFSVAQNRSDESADWLVARALDQNEHVELRKHALFWAGQQRALPIARLSELYDRMPGRELKEQLVFALSQRARDPEAVDVLMKIARTEKDAEIRKQAIFWLGQSRDPRAAKFLLELIKN